MRPSFLTWAPLVSVVATLACSGTVGSSPNAARSGELGAAAERSDSNPAPGLSDLVGVRGSAAETRMQARGYTAVGGHSEAAAAITYWRLARDGSCVSVRTADGRYEAIAPATQEDCARAEKATQVVAKPDAGGYRTGCGMMVDGKPVRYVCSVVGGDQHSTPTTLRFPHMVMVLNWRDAKRVRVELEGTVPIEGTWTDSEGETTITTPERTWFYASNRQAAAMEVQSLENLCSDAWYRSIEEKVTTGDGQGHGPDVGSDEWKSVIEFKLGIRDDPGVPSRKSQAWCRHIDGLVQEGRTPPAPANNATATAGPSFSCKGVRVGSIEEMICKDPDLSALDRKLADVYAAASRKATNEHPPVLKAEQRGWMKGRDECWKSDDKRACLLAEYTRRIAELQARYRLVPGTGPVFFACDGNPANEVVVTFFETEPPTLIAERGDSVSLMYRERSGSGAKYQGRNETFWEHGGEASVTWGYEASEMRCKKKAPRTDGPE